MPALFIFSPQINLTDLFSLHSDCVLRKTLDPSLSRLTTPESTITAAAERAPGYRTGSASHRCSGYRSLWDIIQTLWSPETGSKMMHFYTPRWMTDRLIPTGRQSVNHMHSCQLQSFECTTLINVCQFTPLITGHCHLFNHYFLYNIAKMPHLVQITFYTLLTRPC